MALNKLNLELLGSLRTLQLGRYQSPVREQPLRTVEQIVRELAAGKHLIADYDVEARFREEVEAAEAAIARTLEEGHALVNGKWLVRVFAPRTLGGSASPDTCLEQWIEHAIRTGGLPAVRQLWEQIANGSP